MSKTQQKMSNGVNKQTEKFYITTPIYYVNDKPHVGHAYTSIIADILARYQKNLSKEVYFLTGTDEHGRKIAEAAAQAGLHPKSFVDKNAPYFKDLLEILNISNDYFIRTTDENHWPKVVELWNKLKNRGDIYKGIYQGLYCVGHETFLKASELKNGLCPDHLTKPEIVEEENYFFRLSKYAREIELRIKNDELKIIPETRKNEVLEFIKSGLEDISFSRPRKDLKWGIPVPDDETQTVYVWFDALTNYISGLKSEFDKFFPPDVQIIGKDILRFHTTIWPAVLLSAGLPLPKTIFIHGYITVEGQKISKSLGNIINPFELVKKYGADPLRYYLLREFSPASDGDFSINRLENRYQDDLVNGLSNLVHRLLILAWNNKNLLKGKIKPAADDKNKKITEKCHQAIRNFEFNEVLNAIWEIISLADKKINDEKLWNLPKENPAKFNLIANELIETLNLIANLLDPFLPSTSGKILKLIKLKEKPEPIFKKS